MRTFEHGLRADFEKEVDISDPLFFHFQQILYEYQRLGISSNIPTFSSFVKQLFYVDQNKCGHFNLI